MNKIPFFYLNREYKKYKTEIFKRFDKSLEKGQVLQSKSVIELENYLAKLHNRKYCITTGSCTDSLYFSLISLNLRKGDEILVTCFSYIASATCILRAGLKPVFVDIDHNYEMDIDDANLKVTKNTRCVLVVNIFGKAISRLKIKRFAKMNKLKVIEDNAQSFGAKSEGEIAGMMGDFSCLSFDPTKLISAYGSGGAVLTDSFANYKKIKRLRYHGKEFGEFRELGYNSQLSSMNAELLRFKIKLEKINKKKRIEYANFYIENLSYKFITPKIEYKDNHVFHKFVIRTKKRDSLIQYCKSNNIEVMIHYDKPIYQNKIFKKFNYKCKNAENFCKEVLSLPIHSYLNENELNYIVKKLNKFAMQSL